MGQGSDTNDLLGAVRFLIGSLAALGALIYLSGGLVLSLRLALSGLPSIGVVGQLPREFLFGLGVTSVIGPAVLIGVLVGVAELGQVGEGRLGKGHLPWSIAKYDDAIRSTYVRFYAAAPLLLLTPAFVVAVERDNQITHKALLYVSIGVPALACVVALLRAARDSRIAERSDTITADSSKEKLQPAEWAKIGAACAVTLIPTAWLLVFEPDQTSPLRYLGLTGAWLVTFLIVLLVIWLRGQIGARFRKDQRQMTQVIILSWLATAVLLLPGVVAASSALPLQKATICLKQPPLSPTGSDGRLVGETSSRIYIGDVSQGNVRSVPTGNVQQFVFGDRAEQPAVCRS